ncbi:GD14919 [Drosophila simulans]|uniref:GD14919 n=1 Tax=Drosophila simulans TaxID=7240 RepID=B4QJ88_DROSI|nr:GD14919 [Drosophila simulans]
MGSKGCRKEKKRVQVPLERVRDTTPKQDTPSHRVLEVLTSHLSYKNVTQTVSDGAAAVEKHQQQHD